MPKHLRENSIAAGPSLDLGCGSQKRPGAVGVDIVPFPGVDLVADLNRFPYPFKDNAFSRIVLSHVIEHLADVVAVMEEVYRIAKPGATVEVLTPHYTDNHSWGDPTHRWHLNTRSFDQFRDDLSDGRRRYSRARFRVECEVRLCNLGRWCGIQRLVNSRRPRLRWVRQLWERQFSFLLRGSEMRFRMVVVKQGEGMEQSAPPRGRFPRA